VAVGATKDSSAVQNASHAVLEEYRVEVKEETNAVAGELEVGEELGAVDGSELLRSLYLHDYSRFNEQVDANFGIQLRAL
jgi:hypothetical protein